MKVIAVWVTCSDALRASNPSICHEGIRRDEYVPCQSMSRHYHATGGHEHLMAAHGGIELEVIREHVG